MLRLEDLLFTQGFGTRRECQDIIYRQRVRIDNVVHRDPDEVVDETQPKFQFEVDGEVWPYYSKTIIAMNKPVDYECSQKPSNYPSVMTLLPPQLRRRGVQPVGRLDADTTGLLLLTDDGHLLHRITHPKTHLPKRYRVYCKHAIKQALIDQLLVGVLLTGEKKPVKADEISLVDDHTLDMTITSGKYHQVKRMIAAASNRCDRLERLSVGKFELPSDLAPGHWVWIDSVDQIMG